MRLQFLGAARTVTGSMHYLSVNGKRLLLDCGLFQGRRAEAFERNRSFPFDPSTIDAVVLSHAHIDHAGNLPNLVRHGFRGSIYCTPATKDLCGVMLYDSAHINERDVEYMNKKLKKNNEPLVEPLYTMKDVDAALGRFSPIRYRTTTEISEGVRVTFYDAGHILGSAAPLLEIKEGSRTLKLGFTGDLGRKKLAILKDPEPMGDVDALISESTYGNRIHESREGMKDRFLAVVKNTVERGGKIIIPAFSVGRTQEIVYQFFELFDEGRLPAIPIYVDSPLAVNVTEVFRNHEECFDAETVAYLRQNEDPFGFKRLKFISSVEESKALNEKKEPCAIISASGMCEAGRILHHLANNVEDSKNTVLIVGFQAEHTLGRRLVEKAPEVKIFGDVYKLRADVQVLNAYSAHAGQDELLAYIGTMDKKRLKNVFLVHGELDRAQILQQKLNEAELRNVVIPQRGEEAEL
ncbi:MAG: MBL fold metallo-hydrolase [Ignavibacteriae bacterium]|nr:MBL fold metallo-hydrolase [Ignavibacteriota bacterium]